MVKPEWGTKRSCPKCGTRFYDLGKDEPIACIACGVTFNPETILKSKQPMPFEAVKAEVAKKDDDDLAEELIEAEEEEPSADEEVDLGGDDDLGVNTNDGEEES